MKIALVVTPMSSCNLRLAKQIGVTDIVGRFPGESLTELTKLKKQVDECELNLSVIEDNLPMDQILLNTDGREEQLHRMKLLVENMGKAGIPVLCYNFMSVGDMSRTSFNIPDRGGALVSRFDIEEYEDPHIDETSKLNEDQLWTNLESFLREILPVAEQSGVKLAMHPDDPPGIPRLHGLPRIMGSIQQFEQLVSLVPSPSNGICFCQGCFSEMGVDVVAAVHRFGPYIHYVHVRDVVGKSPNFQETFHDCGQTDMAAAMRAYYDIGFNGVMRPDHVPSLEGEEAQGHGYTMLGRLFAVGYMRGLQHAVENQARIERTNH